ncbi:hypothetical protein EHM69_01540 [candidate division KSB1 bacterium]|nr:MAG: hypothetical protein EHM69_01540 [candidate division KSB1 bacterium]
MNGRIDILPAQQQGGFVMVAIMAVITVLLATSIAFMRWSTDESFQSVRSAAAMQAYYLGQMGIVEKGFQWLRTRPASDLPIGETPLPGRNVPGYGRYETVKIFYLPSMSEGDFWSIERRYRISCIGVVKIPVQATDRRRETEQEIKRKAVLYVQVRNFADYMYLSNEELTSFGDRIKFWNGDTLNGRVHSNSMIAIMQSPVFYDQVTTTAEDFWRGSAYNPIFHGPLPIFRAPRVEIPELAQRLREGASEQGNFLDYQGKTIRACFNGGSVTLFRFDTGAPFDSTDSWSIPVGQGTCIFVNGPLEIKGTVTGKVTIGSHGTCRILDNIRYSDSNVRTGVTPTSSSNILGIVSETDVKIANTPENGRENSGITGGQSGNNQTNQARTSVVITAAIVALGESFTFENQNDPDSGYVCDCQPDDRGTIYVFGSITQMRRGYVHRSTRSSTGYLKKYVYDKRLLRTRPPCFFDVTDDQGHALFNVVQWGQGKEYAPDNEQWNVVRYN